MPPAVAAAGIAAGASLGGALLQNRGNNKALEAQDRAAQRAEAMERERMGMERDQWNARERNRLALWRRMGFDVPDSEFEALSSGGGGRGGLTLGALAGAPGYGPTGGRRLAAMARPSGGPLPGTVGEAAGVPPPQEVNPFEFEEPLFEDPRRR
jgi:hypothetical protein